MTNTTNTDSPSLNLRALEEGILRMHRIARTGIQCEARDDVEGALALGTLAGDEARRAGLTMDETWNLLRREGIGGAPNTWGAVVDGWYAAA